jgi:hypothetical protein
MAILVLGAYQIASLKTNNCQRTFFQIEGAATIVSAGGAYFVLPNFPTTTPWLTEREKWLCAARLRADGVGATQGDAEVLGHGKAFKSVLSDWRTYVRRILSHLIRSRRAHLPTLTGHDVPLHDGHRSPNHSGKNATISRAPEYPPTVSLPVLHPDFGCKHGLQRHDRPIHDDSCKPPGPIMAFFPDILSSRFTWSP